MVDCRLCVRVFVLIFPLLLASCIFNQRSCEYHEIRTHELFQNSSRILIYADDPRPPFTLEFIQTQADTRLYLNLLRMEAFPHPDYLKRTSLEITIHEESMTVHPYLLKGGQRLLFTDDIRDLLIRSLLEGQCVKIKLSHREYSLISEGFEKAYDQFQKTPK